MEIAESERRILQFVKAEIPIKPPKLGANPYPRSFSKMKVQNESVEKIGEKKKILSCSARINSKNFSTPKIIDDDAAVDFVFHSPPLSLPTKYAKFTWIS